MKLLMTQQPPMIELEFNSSKVASSETAGTASLSFDEQGKLVRITFADPTWRKLPKVEFEGFALKKVSFEVLNEGDTHA